LRGQGPRKSGYEVGEAIGYYFSLPAFLTSSGCFVVPHTGRSNTLRASVSNSKTIDGDNVKLANPNERLVVRYGKTVDAANNKAIVNVPA
jgi:hypothetical protein